jgi:hypothetical protein
VDWWAAPGMLRNIAQPDADVWDLSLKPSEAHMARPQCLLMMKMKRVMERHQ